jgi:alkylation response protein AidB-like acyl-CoA dehydrogenase
MNKLGAFALTEPEHGSDSIALETSAQVMRHMVDLEAIHTFEGTETMQTLIAGRHHRHRSLHVGEHRAPRA